MKMSYMVGYGSRFPQMIHHRGSSVPSVVDHPGRIGCKDGSRYFLSNNPNPNLLIGAVVGGPNISDDFPDSRPYFQLTEPTTYSTFIGPSWLFLGPFVISHLELEA